MGDTLNGSVKGLDSELKERAIDFPTQHSVRIPEETVNIEEIDVLLTHTLNSTPNLY